MFLTFCSEMTFIFIIFYSLQLSQAQYYPCPVCEDSECSPRVCGYTNGGCDHTCVDCRDDSECRWTFDSSNSPFPKPYCFNNECVECLDDSYCGKDKPHCSEFRTCEPCLENIHCRNATQCNGVCGYSETGIGFACKPGGSEFLQCEQGEICYKWLGECHKECFKVTTIQTTWTSPFPTQSPFPPINCPPANSSLTKNSQCGDDGVCYECTTNSDCNTNQNCGSTCQYENNHYYCTANAKECSSTQNCTLNQTSKQFFCSSSASSTTYATTYTLYLFVCCFWLLFF